MFEVETDSGGPAAAWILKLQRRRLVRLSTVWAMALRQARTARVLQLLGRYFLDYDVAEVWPASWYSLLADLVNLVRGAGWFEVDDRTLDTMHEWLMSAGDDDVADDDLGPAEPFPQYVMAQFLYGIPVARYGFCDEDWHWTVVENWPGLALLRGMLDSGYRVNGWHSAMQEMDVYGLDDFEPDRALANIGPATHAEPLCWLPEVVRFCRRDFDNPLLNTGFEDTDPLESILAFQWDRPGDLDKVKQWSAEGRPVWDRVLAVAEWLGDDFDRQRQAVWLLLGVGGDDE